MRSSGVAVATPASRLARDQLLLQAGLRCLDLDRRILRSARVTNEVGTRRQLRPMLSVHVVAGGLEAGTGTRER